LPIRHCPQSAADASRADRLVANLGDPTVSLTLRYWTSSADFFSTQIDMTNLRQAGLDTKVISIPLCPPREASPERRLLDARKQ